MTLQHIVPSHIKVIKGIHKHVITNSYYIVFLTTVHGGPDTYVGNLFSLSCPSPFSCTMH